MKTSGLLLILILTAALSFGEETKMEVRVYFQDPDLLIRTMGDLFGELDICTVQEASPGEYYLVINTVGSQLERIRVLGLKTEVTWPDIADKFWQMIGKPRDPQILRDFGLFYTYWEMRDSINAFASRYPAICKKDSLGRSYQNLALLSLKISDNVAVDEGEPAMCINGATHAREPMGTHLCIDFAQWLLYNYGIDSLATWLVNNRQIYIIPVMNPDGYRYNSDSGGTTSNIRKNRHFYTGQSSGTCGVDLNRNYGYKWGYDNSGSSPNVTSETFRGSARFSELETQESRDYFLPKKIRIQNDYHSYGPYNLCVWGYSTNHEPIPDSATVWEVLDSMRAKNGYSAARTGPISRVLYLANGGSCEWETKDTLHNGVQKFSTLAVSIEANQTDFWDGWNNQTVINTNITQCRPINIYYAKVAGVFFDNLALVVADTALGNRTCQLDPNENSHMWFSLRNRAIHPLDSAYNITGNLVSLDTQVTVTDPTASFPKIYRKVSGNNSADRFQVHCSPNAVPGTYKKFRLVMTFKDDTCTITQALRCSLIVGNNPVGVAESNQPAGVRPELSVCGNPCRGRVVFQTAHLTRTIGRLEIFNSAGQLVTSQKLVIPSDRFAWIWNGLDEQDQKAVPGVYFYRFATPAGAVIGTFVLLK